MASGFIFNSNKCVNCGSCAAACVVENGWQVRPRNIITYNSEAAPLVPLFNLSMACNNCETPACLEGCPASAYFREPSTGAVVIDDSRCIGCRYCLWNCPYDAPKIDSRTRVIGKCNLCFNLIKQNLNPACASSCPTGALSYGELPGRAEKFPVWFPEKNLNPSVYFSGLPPDEPLKIEPLKIFRNEPIPEPISESTISHDWSLIIFTFLATLSSSITVSSFLRAEFVADPLPALLILISGIVSLLHLGKPSRAWRAVFNIRKSPLSREIALFILFSLFSVSAFFLQLPILLIAASISGTMLLFVIDSVYIFSDRRISLFLNSGQTLITMLIIASFFGDFLPAFLFAAGVKLILSSYSLFYDIKSGLKFKLRYVRIAILVIVMIFIGSGSLIREPGLVAVFLTGELLDRILFYLDFDPVNIKTLMFKKIKFEK
jgi:Fe-S-cluster-containing dehydrogenase component